MLEVEQLFVNYRGLKAVENVSFCVKEGEIVGIIGPNGAGKSTILKAILGLISVETGVIKYQSQSITKKLQQVAYIPQRAQIDWDYPITVEKVVMMARIRHTGLFRSYSRQSRSIVQHALEKVEMWELRNRVIGELSGGQQQRIFLAQALAQEAQLFLFDEPFIGVDKKTESMLFDVFDEMKSQGKILIVVGHELKETTRNYDRFLLINKTLIADGTQKEVITANNIQKAYGDNVIFFERNKDD